MLSVRLALTPCLRQGEELPTIEQPIDGIGALRCWYDSVLLKSFTT